MIVASTHKGQQINQSVCGFQRQGELFVGLAHILILQTVPLHST